MVSERELSIQVGGGGVGDSGRFGERKGVVGKGEVGMI